MLESHNDAAVAIAEGIDGSVEAFAQRMNQKAEEIGCKNTYFISPNGLDAQDSQSNHHTTARELALILRYCIMVSPQREAFLKIHPHHAVYFSGLRKNFSYSCNNHNAFLNMMEGALTGKTGFTCGCRILLCGGDCSGMTGLLSLLYWHAAGLITEIINGWIQKN